MNAREHERNENAREPREHERNENAREPRTQEKRERKFIAITVI